MVNLLMHSLLLVELLLSCALIIQVDGLTFSYPLFKQEATETLIELNSYVVKDAIQVTPDLSRPEHIEDQSGRSFYIEKFKLWRKSKGSVKRASFNTTFVLNISNQTIVGGEGLAFILTGNSDVPESSHGQWLGIVNENTNGSSQAQIVAVEFDTRKSYPEDLDSNHVGLDVNGIFSIKQVSLSSSGIQLDNGTDVTVIIQYDGSNIIVFASSGNDSREAMKNRIFSERLDLSAYLPQEVYVGFSASTSKNTQLNCVRSWNFHGLDIDSPSKRWVWITIVVVVVALLGCVAIYLYRRWTRKPEDGYPRIEDIIGDSSLAPRKFKLKDLKKATGNFNKKNKLGKGGFGTVYRGLLEKNEVAIKKVSEDSTQGKDEFIAEVTTIGSLHHKNLVRLIGWCYERRDFLLVYECLPNSSLDKYLHWDEKTGIEEMTLTWGRRYNALCGVAEALNYLHNGCEKRVLHRDVKSSNIMLDSEFNAKLGDFGLARTIQQKRTHHSTNIAGTPGYMAPESFLAGGRVTIETDIYAFGILALEVVSGRKPGIPTDQNDNNIVHWIWDLYKVGRILDAVDSRLKGDSQAEEMEIVLLLGLACCHPNPHQRPSMKIVLQVLMRQMELPEVPRERPAFMWPAMPPSFKSDHDSSLTGGRISILTEITGR